MANLSDVAALAAREQHFAVVATVRADATVQSTVVNAGHVAHPRTGRDALAFVTYGPVKLANLRRRPQVTVTFRSGWEWLSVEGTAELFGPHDALGALGAPALAALLREIFIAAGGTHDDWPSYDRTMVEQGRTAVVISPLRVYGN